MFAVRTRRLTTIGWICLAVLLIAAGAYLAAIYHLQPSRKEPVLFNWYAWWDNPTLVRSVLLIRLPRIAAAILVGAALGVSGCLLQALTRNELADPEVMGINQGANMAMAVLLVLLQFETFRLFTIMASMIGTAIGGAILYALSRLAPFRSGTLVLIGLVNSLLFSSITTTLVLFHDTDLFQLLHWMAGELSGKSWVDVRFALLFLVPFILFAAFKSGQFNLLQLSEESAISAGQKLKRVRSGIILCLIVLVGASTAICGPIGFIGLMAPHLARLIIGVDYRRLLPLSAIIGSLILLYTDLAGRMIFYPVEAPVGMITAFVGSPFLLLLLQKTRGNRL